MIFDAALAGTPTASWEEDARLHDRPPLDLEHVSQLIVIAAHPDDETLGAGALLAECASRGIPTRVIVVTDGAASHPGDASTASRREAEVGAAVAVLAPGARLDLLGFADGQTEESRDAIVAALTPVIAAVPRGALIACPWRGDGHRDHRVVGEVVAELVVASSGAPRLIEYPIWLWHWGDARTADVPWSRFVSLAVTSDAKCRAIAEHTSQVEGASPVLRTDFLSHFTRDTEFFIAADGLGAAYFEETYQRHDDPWGFESRWYEQRKRAVTMAALPEPRFARALEIGCSIGVLTADLVSRCDELIAVDIAEAAVQATRDRVGPTVDVRHLDIGRDVPAGPFDLIVLSEVGYYFDRAALDDLLRKLQASLTPTGTLLACHWRHPVIGYPLSGDDVHERIGELGFARMTLVLDDDFLLEVFSADERSVAARGGLL